MMTGVLFCFGMVIDAASSYALLVGYVLGEKWRTKDMNEGRRPTNYSEVFLCVGRCRSLAMMTMDEDAHDRRSKSMVAIFFASKLKKSSGGTSVTDGRLID